MRLFGLIQIGRAGKAYNGIDVPFRRPLIDDSAEFNVTADRVVHFVDKYGQIRQGSNQASQFVRLTVFFIVIAFAEHNLSVLFVDSV